MNLYALFSTLVLLICFLPEPVCLAQAPQISLARPGALPEGLDLHGSVVVGKRLYIIGGKVALAWNRKVWSAAIGSNSVLSDWREEAELPEFRTHIGELTQTANNRIYILGGLAPEDPKLNDPRIRSARSILYTTVQQDGKLSPWQKGPHVEALPPVNGGSCSSDGKYLYLVGGERSGQATADVLISVLDSSGAPSQWQMVSRLPKPLHFLGATCMNGRMYVWGGRGPENGAGNAGASPDVYSAPVAPDGTVGEWTKDGEMPVPLYRSAFLGFNDYLVCVGGLIEGGRGVTDIWFSHLDNGKLGPWQLIRSDLESHMFHPVAVDADRGGAFITGGRVADSEGRSKAYNVTQSIQAFQLPDSAPSSVVQPAAHKDSEMFANSAVARQLEFGTLSDALGQARTTGRPVLALFYSPRVPACRRVQDQIASDPDLSRFSSRFHLAAVDSSGSESEKSYQYGVFQVPSLVVIRPDGEPESKLLGVRSWNNARTWLADEGY